MFVSHASSYSATLAISKIVAVIASIHNWLIVESKQY
jgi:hypothetical protein